jgi:hypothetical protein
MKNDNKLEALPGIYHALYVYREAVEDWRKCSGTSAHAYPSLPIAKVHDECVAKVVVSIKDL